jgi:hypothetical protein
LLGVSGELGCEENSSADENLFELDISIFLCVSLGDFPGVSIFTGESLSALIKVGDLAGDNDFLDIEACSVMAGLPLIALFGVAILTDDLEAGISISSFTREVLRGDFVGDITGDEVLD